MSTLKLVKVAEQAAYQKGFKDGLVAAKKALAAVKPKPAQKKQKGSVVKSKTKRSSRTTKLAKKGPGRLQKGVKKGPGRPKKSV